MIQRTAKRHVCRAASLGAAPDEYSPLTALSNSGTAPVSMILTVTVPPAPVNTTLYTSPSIAIVAVPRPVPRTGSSTDTRNDSFCGRTVEASMNG